MAGDDKGRAAGSRPGRAPNPRSDRGQRGRPDRGQRADRDSRPRDPWIPEDVTWAQLGKEVRERLRSLTKENAERVGGHLVMVGNLLDDDPELAYAHAQAAVRRAGRIDVVREAAGLAAYRTGRYAEALRELRTVKRINGSAQHLPLMADAERGLGRPERALDLVASPEAATLDATGRVELALVASGARCELGDYDAALAVLDRLPAQTGDLGVRVVAARAAALEAAGRGAEAAALLTALDPEALDRAAGNLIDDLEVVVYDAFDEDAEAVAEAGDTVTCIPTTVSVPADRLGEFHRMYANWLDHASLGGAAP